jgi:hypothetical protein
VEYDKIVVVAKPALSALPVVDEIRTIAKSDNGVSLVSDGFSYSVDPQLKELLEYCVAEQQPFIVDGFKSLTRNITKLLLIIEHLLSNETAFVTSNYFLLNGHIECRKKLLRVGRNYDAGHSNWLKIADVGKWHRAVLMNATNR